MGIMFLRGGFWGWIILGCLIGVSRCRRGGGWSRLMRLLGWHFIVFRCCRLRSSWRDIVVPMKVPPPSPLFGFRFLDLTVDIASKFLEHFLFIADALSFDSKTGDRISLWHNDDGFYYDAINWGGPWKQPLPIKSLVGLIPLFAVLVIEPDTLERFPGFKRRFEWFLEERKGLSTRIIASTGTSATSGSRPSTSANGDSSPSSDAVNGGIKPSFGGKDDLGRHLEIAAKQNTEREIATENLRKEHPKHRRLFALVDDERLRKILTHMLSETQFLSDHGIRSYAPLLLLAEA
jgi:hypothetical protein